MKKMSGKEKLLVLAAALIAATLIYMNMGQKNVPLAECFQEENVKQQAMDDIMLGEAGDYGKWKARFAPEEQEKLTEEIYKKYLESVAETAGFEEFTECVINGHEAEGNTYAVAIVTAKHERGKLKYVVIYNEKMQIVTYTV